MDMPLLDEIDLEILQHRDAHFGGSFRVMIDYYKEDGIGTIPDFPLSRIKELQKIEESIRENLSEKLLPTAALEDVARSRALYLQLREVYEHPKAKIPILISDLILSEEEEPLKEIKAILAAGEKVIPPLLHLIDSVDFYNPLFPGYGRAPAFAALCLSQLKTLKAIPHLFRAMGCDNLDVEEVLISSLVSFGEPAKEFLLKALSTKIITKDNYNAAMALSFFPPDPIVAKSALSLLSKEKNLMNEAFAPYLICLVEGLEDPEDRKIFKTLTETSSFPKDLKLDAHAVLQMWKPMKKASKASRKKGVSE